MSSMPGIWQLVLLYISGVHVSGVFGNTFDLYQIIKCENPQFDPKIIGWFYGCYCGPGGAGTPVDPIDKCCQQHDQCYQQMESSDGCGMYWPLLSSVSYSCASQKAICQDSQPCKHAQCQCDTQLAHCLNGITTPSKRAQCKDYFRSQKPGLSWLTH
ncbi:phospholipase A2-like [Paramacrobiotus metropolitanus]|uniref:phospholipase A2-like n=1 Tax=Paramacrobiotus metropolitanus TaxID=2943436 RepID=UPI002445A24E|nr:phospholipase A2-like [Paramacrobiotus metropolitanus]